jgi:hypothetical protein
MNKRLPVLLIGYLRLNGIIKSVEDLASFGVTEIYLAIDGAKNEEDLEKQSKMINVLRRQFRDTDVNLEIWHRPKNLGLAVSVITAIDWFFSKNHSGIILEDDIYFDENFLDFCEKAWATYDKIEDIWMVSGSNFITESCNSTVKFINYPLIWGWCSSVEKWKRIRTVYFTKPKLSLRDWLIPKFTYFLVGTIRANSQNLDTWDIQIAYEMLNVGAYSVLPPVNLVCNKGFDDKAIHTIEAKFPLNLPIREIDFSKIVFPSRPDSQVKKVNSFYESTVFRVGYRHWIALLKLTIINLLFNKNKYFSLKAKLDETSLPND